MLSAIFSTFGVSIINGFLDKGLAAFTAYQNKQISKEQLIDQLYAAMVSAVRDVEVAHADALAKTFATFWDAANKDQTNLMKIMWAAALGSQIFVLFWSQWCAPLLFAYGFMDKGWHAGTTAEWSYLLIGALLGLGPMVLRAGPAVGTLSERLKAMIGK